MEVIWLHCKSITRSLLTGLFTFPFSFLLSLLMHRPKPVHVALAVWSPSEEGSAGLPASRLWELSLRRLDSPDRPQGVISSPPFPSSGSQCPHGLLSRLLLSNIRSKTVNYSFKLNGAHFKVRAAGHLGLRVAKGEGPHVWVQQLCQVPALTSGASPA